MSRPSCLCCEVFVAHFTPQADLAAGDTIYIPAGWIHGVTTYSAANSLGTPPRSMVVQDLASDRYHAFDCDKVRNKITTFVRTAATFPDDPHPNETVFAPHDMTRITTLLQNNLRNAVVLRQFSYQVLNLAIGQLADAKLASIGELRRAGNATSAGLPSSFAMVGVMEIGLPGWNGAVTGRAFTERNRAGHVRYISVCKDSVFLKALLRATKMKPEDGPPATPGYADRLSENGCMTGYWWMHMTIRGSASST